MGLSDIAAGLETTTAQTDRGVASVDATDRPLADGLEQFAEAIPCTVEAAATVAEAYVGGAPVDVASHDAGIAPVTAAKTLHRLGFTGLSPVSPTGERVLEDYLAGAVTREDARALLGISDGAFALAAYIATHDPIQGARAVVDGALSPDATASVEKRDALAETMSDANEFL